MKKVIGILALVGVGLYVFAGNKKNNDSAAISPGDANEFEGKIIEDRTTKNWLYITGGKAYFVSEAGWAYYQSQNPGYTTPTVDAQKYYPVSGDYLAGGQVKPF